MIFASRLSQKREVSKIFTKLVVALHCIVDYVDAYELPHPKRRDDQLTAFWKSVERFLLDYVECRAWLKELG